jgi:hypothetical protein
MDATAFRPNCDALRRELEQLGAGGTGPALPPYCADRACAPGCNCVARLLGPEIYRRECAAGALFLLEGWARDWPRWARAMFGADGAVLRELLRADHRYLLGVRTPCSGDFTAAAVEAGHRADLPVRWIDVDLTELAAALAPKPGGRWS